MTLGEAIARLDEWSDDATIYVAGEPSDWSSDSEAAVGIEDVQPEVETLPAEAEGKRYFLEVSVAREVLAGEARHLGHDRTLDEKIARVIHYAQFDAQGDDRTETLAALIDAATRESQAQLTLNDVRNDPALPQLTWIGHLPAVVFVPTIHVHETRPFRGRFGQRPWATEGPLLQQTVIVQRLAGATRATSVAYEPGEAGDVTLTSRTEALTVGVANAAVAATSAANPTAGASNLFTIVYIGSRTFTLETRAGAHGPWARSRIRQGDVQAVPVLRR